MSKSHVLMGKFHSKKGRIEGPVKVAYANSDIYEGLLVSGLRSGKGKMTYANGTVYYKGDFLNGMHSGRFPISSRPGGGL